jgi:hypothetical protein
MTLINASEGGAYIEGFEHIPLGDALQQHVSELPNRHVQAEIERTHEAAPRLSVQQRRTALDGALRDYGELRSTVDRALERLERVNLALERDGPQSAAFNSALATFEQAEGQVRDQSMSNPLIEPYISGRVTSILQDRSWLDEDITVADKWRHHLGQSQEILELVAGATMELTEVIEDLG